MNTNVERMMSLTMLLVVTHDAELLYTVNT